MHASYQVIPTKWRSYYVFRGLSCLYNDHKFCDVTLPYVQSGAKSFRFFQHIILFGTVQDNFFGIIKLNLLDKELFNSYIKITT